MRILSYAGVGALFSTGLVLAEMTNPVRVLRFLDFTGDFDPSLLWVMVGAILAHGVTHRWVLRRASPLFGGSFSIPKTQRIDVRLILGSALFGVGWGLAGYCPGPVLTSAFTLDPKTVAFLVGMLGGLLLFASLHSRARRPSGAPIMTPSQGP